MGALWMGSVAIYGTAPTLLGVGGLDRRSNAEHLPHPMTEQIKLRGRKALVTGSDTGIDLEIGREFARQGADVVFY
jgi:hypothetical protein